ncbi:D-alanyl-D-alanine carboxypeptidase family protein [Faecalibacterium langellae]|uniref:D-alanyl-D-alanine carboxypeptidase n=1 Tax=Faecalibacterium langellae TaxID=3435293 RepID=A0ACC9D116_9FIRM|nr:D-alanyl-D-alanine carboxypeptidase family protein [Faecalibacterium prausnitzii]PDX61848.1 D-alanyl-D-alanine carboxypeptidase [Faecalibacterium prausnitzii]
MFQNRFFRRAAALVLTLALAAAAALPGLAAYPMPIQTASETEAVYLFNADTGKTILAQNADQQQYVASLTKMMTALLLLESGKDLNGEVTVPTAMTQEFKDIQNANGMTAGLRIGETVRRIDLLYALLVSSANDAASVIAYDVGGSVLDFVRQMNARAAELGCTGTNFTCAHGLFDYGNVSTAEDMARIAAECYKNPTFVQVSGTAAYTMPATNLHQNERTINSTNPLTDTGSEFYRSYIKCVKGGFTTLAGRCAVAFAEQGGHTYGLVILHADNASLYTECDQLLDWAFESFSDRPLVDTQTELTTIDLTKCRAQPTAALYAAAPVSGYGHADDVVSYAFDLPESIPATVKNGQKVGTATVYLDGYEVGTVDLVTHAEYISDFRTDSKATLLLLCTLVVILGALTVLTLAAGGGALSLRRRKRRH